jgi:hypothetical protein
MNSYTTQEEIREAFWNECPDLEREARSRKTLSKGHNAQTTECRAFFNEWLDALVRNGEISEKLADKAAL